MMAILLVMNVDERASMEDSGNQKSTPQQSAAAQDTQDFTSTVEIEALLRFDASKEYLKTWTTTTRSKHPQRKEETGAGGCVPLDSRHDT
jgi:hypothetical protein